jgi:predicted PurR-regulated permease PerM
MTGPIGDADAVFLRRTALAAGVVAAVAITLAIAWWARWALLIIYLSLLVAAGVARPVQAIESWRLPRGWRVRRWIAALVVYALVIGVIAGIAVVVLEPFMVQASELWTTLPHEFDRLQEILRQYGLVSRHVTFQEAVQNVPRTDALRSMNTVLTAGFTFAGLIAAAISVVILSYYIVVQGETTAWFLLRFAPEPRQEHVREAIRECVVRITHWIEGTLIVGAIMGIVTASVLGTLGVPFFYVVAFVAALGEAVPMVGPILAGAVAVMASWTVSAELAFGVAIFFTVLHEIEANILVPKIMEERVGIGAIAVMCGLLIGWELTGILGAVIAIPTVAIVTVIAEQSLRRPRHLRVSSGQGTGISFRRSDL